MANTLMTRKILQYEDRLLVYSGDFGSNPKARYRGGITLNHLPHQSFEVEGTSLIDIPQEITRISVDDTKIDTSINGNWGNEIEVKTKDKNGSEIFISD